MIINTHWKKVDVINCLTMTFVVFAAGNPIEVSKVDNPTKEQVNELHCEFVQKLEEVFEKNKHHFVQNPEESFLEFV